ncbi:SDR family NAD(P)-dependent oxidoreductase [Legionella bononiensis]|uniref:SDR family NAD(P)-dependent oxidoreductase n=1 Tax=Legionella bononiensis TaxID=2793102 RepID=A0ABS1WCU6_9GAMM|nr:SDR family NAD(P)-dependent oxidoreductase [Legionella bononiensis]MBL7479045.1 SDR family NAD(P)-dependent oxidoreductase [Legionella bononiensis]MBL7527178.1 SDR family NAD(P)-dependent oxidoreductase [Legionella bononiensis]MBL7562147.1 SDR family NAD(P)-dependent oxidoreductase [Legionella bononiensis]
MTVRTWVIIGATSIIAEEFAHCAAKEGNALRLVGRDQEQLNLIARDIELRYQVPCDIAIMDMTQPASTLLTVLKPDKQELDLFIAHSDFTGNNHLTVESITQLVQVNILATTLLIQAYLDRCQSMHHLLFLSSVAACRGRAKNSLYGGSKAAIEVYLQGLQQSATKSQHISIARLGFIDTRQTFGLPGIFHAAQPKDCAKACWIAVNKNKRLIYFPNFWRAIMAVITRIPFFIYKRMGSV